MKNNIHPNVNSCQYGDLNRTLDDCLRDIESLCALCGFLIASYIAMWSSQLVNEIHRMNDALKFSVLAESKEACDYAFTKSKYIDYLLGMVLVTVNILLILRSSPFIKLRYIL